MPAAPAGYSNAASAAVELGCLMSILDVELAHYEFIRSGKSMDDRAMRLTV